MPLPSPYDLYAVFKDGRREKVDPRLSKRLSRAHDMQQLVRFDVEFPMIADFGKMKTEFDNCLKKSANGDGDDGSGEMTTDLATCIRNFARPEQLEGPNAWMCE